MNQQKEKKSRIGIKSNLIMIVSILVVCVLVPMGFIFSGKFSRLLESLGMKTSPNFNDGYVIAEFVDPADDLVVPIPGNEMYKDAANALDIRKFAVKKVKFHALSGMGIAPRFNLTFEFNGKLPNPYESKQKFSLPVIHVYINHHGKTIEKKITKKAQFANIDFTEEEWDYQVVIDGMHDQARIYDPNGQLLGHSLGLYINYQQDKEAPKTQAKTKQQPKPSTQDRPSRGTTRITVGLPMKILGDPAKGEWSYYVFIGLVDLRNPSMMFASEESPYPQVFDYIKVSHDASLTQKR
jgi:hypothetical protein